MRKGRRSAATVPFEEFPWFQNAAISQLLNVVDANGLHVTPFDPNFDAAMEAFAETRHTRGDAMNEETPKIWKTSPLSTTVQPNR